jgi:V/A-type H+/Na+-transporting ATPase subunit F
MSNMAIVGDSTSVMGFRPLGIDIYAFAEAESMREAFPGILAGGHDIIFITEEFYEAVSDLAAPLKEAPLPAIVPIPGVSGSMGLGRRKIDALIEMAVGVQVKT